MVLYIGLLHHDRKDHLSVVATHLESAVLCVFLGVESAHVAGIDLEEVGSDSSGNGTAQLAFGSY